MTEPFDLSDFVNRMEKLESSLSLPLRVSNNSELSSEQKSETVDNGNNSDDLVRIIEKLDKFSSANPIMNKLSHETNDLTSLISKIEKVESLRRLPNEKKKTMKKDGENKKNAPDIGDVIAKMDKLVYSNKVLKNATNNRDAEKATKLSKDSSEVVNIIDKLDKLSSPGNVSQSVLNPDLSKYINTPNAPTSNNIKQDGHVKNDTTEVIDIINRLDKISPPSSTLNESKDTHESSPSLPCCADVTTTQQDPENRSSSHSTSSLSQEIQDLSRLINKMDKLMNKS